MRKYVVIIAASFSVPGLAVAAQPEHAITITDSDWKACLTENKCDLGDYVRKNAQTKQKPKPAAVQQPPKPTAAAAQSVAPARIPPLFAVPFNPPWLPPQPGGAPWCSPNPQGLFVRADPLDNFHYLVDPAATDTSADSNASSAASAKGASVNFTDDGATRSQTASISGRVSYLVFGETNCGAPNTRETFLYGFAFAPFVSSNGTYNHPFKKTSNSEVQMGADFQIALSTANLWPILDFSYFYVSPYHQTDYRGIADVNGVLFAWEPVAFKLFMDAAPKNNNPYYNFFWQLRAEAQIVQVNDPGLTNLKKGEHDFLGETVSATLGLFPSNEKINWGEWLAGRLSVIGTAQNFYDTQTSKNANYYTVQLQYKLGACKQSTTPGSNTANDNGPTKSSTCAVQGSSAISLEYDWGTNKDTLVFTNQYLLKFSYAY